MDDKRELKRKEYPHSLDWLNALVWSVVIVACCFTFVGRIVGVEGNSMNPTLHNGDKVLVVSSMWNDVKNGDIVLLRKRSFLQSPIIKRVVATEGQTIDIDFDTGSVTVDGEILQEPYAKEPTVTAGDITFPFTVSPGCVFVLGDNRNASTDSRRSELGEVDRRYILGKAVFLLLPGRAGEDSGTVGPVR